MKQWKYQLTFASPVGTHDGLAVAGLVDRMVVRDNSGIPIIPGSSVKGRWRFFAQKLLATDKLPEDFFLHSEKKPICKNPNEACTICKLFGNPSVPGAVWIGPAQPEEPFKTLFQQLLAQNCNNVVRPDTEIRPGVAISRIFKTAVPDHLFFDETVPPVSFIGQILFRTGLTPREEKFLKASGRLVDALGGRKAAGRGILENGIQILEETNE